MEIGVASVTDTVKGLLVAFGEKSLVGGTFVTDAFATFAAVVASDRYGKLQVTDFTVGLLMEGN